MRIEWLNADTEWRDESRMSLLRSLAVYPWRPAETVAALVSHHPRPLLSRWDELVQDAPHRGSRGGRCARAHRDARRSGSLSRPRAREDSVVRGVVQDIRAERRVARAVERTTGGPAHDARRCSTRSARVTSTRRSTRSRRPAALSASKRTSSGAATRADGRLPAAESEVAAVWNGARRSAAPEGSTLRLMCDGKIAAEAPATTVLKYRIRVWRRRRCRAGALPAACRLEAGWNDGDRRVTWLVTNPIYLRANDPTRRRAATRSAAGVSAAAISRSRCLGDRAGSAVDRRVALRCRGPRTPVIGRSAGVHVSVASG